MNEAKTIGNTALVLGTAETAQIGRTEEESKLDRKVSLIEQKASNMVVASDEGFALASELTKQVKEMQKQVTDYWEPMRKSTYEAYTAVNRHKKQMLDPLESAEKILKRKMGDYTMEQERIRREREEAMRKAAEAEMVRKLDEAAEAEGVHLQWYSGQASEGQGCLSDQDLEDYKDRQRESSHQLEWHGAAAGQ